MSYPLTLTLSREREDLIGVSFITAGKSSEPGSESHCLAMNQTASRRGNGTVLNRLGPISELPFVFNKTL
jgi:hypothetical protein